VYNLLFNSFACTDLPPIICAGKMKYVKITYVP